MIESASNRDRSSKVVATRSDDRPGARISPFGDASTAVIRRVLRAVRPSRLFQLAEHAAWRLENAASDVAAQFRSAVSDRIGLEIGGPSSIFGDDGPLPLYRDAKRIDNCNFSSDTIWAGRIEAGETYRYHDSHPPGWQYVLEATDLCDIESGAYDFVLASHSLEHTANPMKALEEWKRVMRPGGSLVVILPNPRKTFDHRRPITSIEHLVSDHIDQTGEDDMTHLDEILSRHDLRRDPQAGTFEQFEARSRRNLQNRCLHHHVFNRRLVRLALRHAGFEVRRLATIPPLHIAALAQKPAAPKQD